MKPASACTKALRAPTRDADTAKRRDTQITSGASAAHVYHHDMFCETTTHHGNGIPRSRIITIARDDSSAPMAVADKKITGQALFRILLIMRTSNRGTADIGH